MHETRPAKITSPITTLNGGHLRTAPVALIVGAIGIGAAIMLSLGSDEGLKRFMFTYLTSFCFVLSISVGCLFFVTIMHLTRAGWSVTVRRVAELYAMCALGLGILFIPILATVISGSDMIYSWNQGGWTMHDLTAAEKVEFETVANRPPLEQMKYQFLNQNFFTVRVIAYFLAWGGMAWFFLSNSLKQDKSGDKNLTSRMQAFSAPLMILFAVTVVFSSFDMEMSLSALWFSTMFPRLLFCRSLFERSLYNSFDWPLASEDRPGHRRNYNRPLP